MVISAAARVATKIVAKAKTKKYFAVQKAKRIKKATIKRGKDAVKVQKTSSTRRIATDDVSDRDPELYIQERVDEITSDRSFVSGPVIMRTGSDGIEAFVGGRPIEQAEVLRRRITTSRTPISPFLITKSEEVSGNPRVFDNPMLDFSKTPEGIEGRTIKVPYIRETVVSAKRSPKKLIVYKKKEQGETGYILSSGLGGFVGSDLSFYPHRPTETVFGIGIGNTPTSKSMWGIAQPKRSVEVFKKTRMDDPDGGDPYGEFWLASHVTGIRVGKLGKQRGVGLQRIEHGTPLTGEQDSNLYTFGALTKSGRVSERPFFSAILDTHTEWDAPLHQKQRQWLSFGFGAKHKVPTRAGTEWRLYNRGVRIPSPYTRKKIKHATLPAFAATSAGFILYPGTEKKAKKKKKRGRR